MTEETERLARHESPRAEPTPPAAKPQPSGPVQPLSTSSYSRSVTAAFAVIAVLWAAKSHALQTAVKWATAAVPKKG